MSQENKNQKPVVIIGANALGRIALDICNANDRIVYCFLDEKEKIEKQELNSVGVLGSVNDDNLFNLIGKEADAFIAIEDLSDKEEMIDTLKKKRKNVPINLFHPMAYVSSDAHIEHGNLINAGGVIGVNAKMGNFCIVHSNAVVEFDAEIGDSVTIGAGSIISTQAIIEDNTFIGSGATIARKVKIGKGATIMSGAVVLKDVPAGKSAFGNPAQIV